MKARIICGLLLAIVACTIALPANAQSSRSYTYTLFDATYEVHPDATVTVTERLTYKFSGAYHEGYRSISTAKTDWISDITVADGDGTPLHRAYGNQDKLDPQSWGSYTVTNAPGAKEVRWYYNLADTEHTWIVTYTLHGAIAFYQDHDELYWNLFTTLDAPVIEARARIMLPGAITKPQATVYVQGDHDAEIAQSDPNAYLVTASLFHVHEPATFAVAWQKGLVHQVWDWHDLLYSAWLYVLALAILGVTTIFAIVYWFFTERYRREVIIAEYAPPQDLPPAMADVVVRERLGGSAWAATIVDLAVRGYLTITEETPSTVDKLFGVKNYILTRTEKSTEGLRPYEEKFLSLLLDDGPFSTKRVRKSPKKQRALYHAFKLLRKHLLEETDELGVYEHPLIREGVGGGMLILVIVTLVLILVFVGSSTVVPVPALVLGCALIASASLVWYLLVFEARLNPEGKKLRRDWLGFKLYLKTAERYRLQNLTPEVFERYLPYAMIFGVEKKWAQAFEGISVPPPTWYSGTAGAMGSSGPVSFSPASFTSSFSASFASSFSSTGAGASAGGGAAGGGGGGGGGGAS